MKIAVLGGGISGLGSAYLLSQKHEVDLYEKESRFGGHARTTQVEENGKYFGVDTGFLVFNYATYPLLTKLFERLGVGIENSNMSFAYWDERKNYVYNGESLKGLFFQKRNLLNPAHYLMIKDILRFNEQANLDLENQSPKLMLSLGEYLKEYSKAFKERYILPMGAAIWSTPSKNMHHFPARTFIQFFKNHGLLGVDGHYQWLTVSGGSKNYVQKLLPHISGKLITSSDVIGVRRSNNGIELQHQSGRISYYDKLVLAMHAPDALALLNDASTLEKEILSAFTYKSNQASLHTSPKALYPNKKVYAAWNYKKSPQSEDVSLSYWLNRLQNLHSKKEYFVTLNPQDSLDEVIEEIEYAHPQFNEKAIAMQTKRELINGVNNTYYAGAYWRYGFHEDGLWSANTIANMLGCSL